MTSGTESYRVLVVDDSPFMRKLVTDMLESDQRLKVVGIAFNGKMALNMIRELNPDVITLDIEMPMMNGIETLRALKEKYSLPVIMFSKYTREGAEITLQALEEGAFDFVQKPDETEGLQVNVIREKLISKVIAGAESYKCYPKKDYSLSLKPLLRTPKKALSEKIIVIGASTGGPRAIKYILSTLPEDFPAKILVVQHMPAQFTEMFAKRLDNICKLNVKEAKEGDIPEPRKVYIAPGDYHMVLDHSGRIRLNKEPPVWGLRPALDMTIKSVSEIYNDKLICIVLTGMGQDGKDGVAFAKKNGAYCIAEHESTCVVYGMPKTIIDNGNADVITPLNNIPKKIIKVLYE